MSLNLGKHRLNRPSFILAEASNRCRCREGHVPGLRFQLLQGSREITRLMATVTNAVQPETLSKLVACVYSWTRTGNIPGSFYLSKNKIPFQCFSFLDTVSALTQLTYIVRDSDVDHKSFSPVSLDPATTFPEKSDPQALRGKMVSSYVIACLLGLLSHLVCSLFHPALCVFGCFS